VDWSYALLSEPERALLARLAVFAGGWTLEAAEQVGADPDGDPDGAGIAPEDVLDLLTRLVDQSLVVAEARPDGTARYRLLETLRQYGREKLAAGGGAGAVHARHARAYLALAERAEPELRGAAQAVWLDRLEAEQPNLRAALRWCLERGEAELGLRLGGALSHFWHVRGDRREARQWLEALLALPAAAPRTAVRAKALAGAGLQAGSQFDLAPAQALYEEALAISREVGDRPGVAAALYGVGFVAQRGGDPAAARGALQESLAAFEGLGDEWGACGALAVLGHVAAAEGDDRAARDLHTEALARARRAGDHWRVVNELDNLAQVAGRQGDGATARVALEEALGLARTLHYQLGITRLLARLARLAVDRGDYATAHRLYGDALAQRTRLGARQGVADLLEGLAAVAAARAQPERALRLAGAAFNLAEATGRVLAFRGRSDLGRWLAPARATLSPEVQAAAWAEGQAMSLEQAVAAALEDAPASA
jgi:hypothetical protein